jgi:hypothetical protein
MNSTEISTYWQENFPLCPPINYLLKIFYTNRFLRIHSLPDSSRYANTEDEWNILHNTQNEILNDVFTTDDTCILFTGEYCVKDLPNDIRIIEEHPILQQFIFLPLDTIDLFARSKDYCEEDTFYIPYFTEINYRANKYNELLAAIADDEIRAFFLNMKTNTIVAPYDGGLDIIYKDEATRDFYKNKYAHFTQQEKFN